MSFAPRCLSHNMACIRNGWRSFRLHSSVLGVLVMVVAWGHPLRADVIASDSAETLVEGAPRGWDLYHGKGTADIGLTAEAVEGKGAVRLRATALEDWQNKPYLNVGLMFGNSDGYTGRRAIEARANTFYRVTFWLRGDAPWVRVFAVCWPENKLGPDGRMSQLLFGEALIPTEKWVKYEGWFRSPPGTARLALKWQLAGFADEGMAPGEIAVDNVEIADMGRLQRKTRRLEITTDVNPMVGKRPLSAVLADLKAGDPGVVAMVERIIANANRWASKNDSWYLHRTPVHTPVGMWTIACPFHPERVRDFSKDNFVWDVEQPWRLVCPLCRDEGRELYTYPNERYPDDGTGCYPTDAVWREDHSPEWSAAHGNIPYDHWDGKAHGYSQKGYCYYFIGKCAHEMMTFGARAILPALAEAYVLSPHVDAVEGRDRQAYAHAVKVMLFSLARAHLGDGYLADLADLDAQGYRDLIDSVYTDDPENLRHRHFPGFTPYDLQDGILGHPEHPANPRRADIYGDGSFRGDAYASGWLQAYALIRNAFGPEEETARQLMERILVAGAEDAERLADGAGDQARKVKPGKLDLALKPYTMNVGHSNNLGGRELANQFDLGVLLNDHDVVRTVVDNAWFYLRNYFNADGLGRETSPAYTNCAWNTMRMIFDRIDGYTGEFDESHPWWDPERAALNPYLDPEMAYDAAQGVFSLYPDGTAIPWMDSHVGHGLQTVYLKRIVEKGRGIPPELQPYHRVTRGPDGVAIDYVTEALPSRLLHESGKAIVRMGPAHERALLALDFAPNTGHYHPAPMDLVLFAKGHELASDLGYFGAMHWLTKDWIRTCPAHNTCIPRDADGNHDFIHNVQGDLRSVWHVDDEVGAVEIVETDPEQLGSIPGENPVYGRTLVMLDAGDPGNPNQYVVDLFRVRGGTWHDYMFHSQGQTCSVDGLDMQALPADVTLHQASGFKDPGEARAGIGRIEHLSRGTSARDARITWQDVADFKVDPPQRSPEVGLRLTLLGGKDTTLFVGQAPGERRMSNADLGEPLHVLCARRENAEEMTVFVAVIEPFRGKPFIERLQALQPGDAPDGTRAVAVWHGETMDVVVSLPPGEAVSEPVHLTLPQGGTLATDGALTVARFRNGQLQFVKLFGGTQATVAGQAIAQRPAFEAALTGLDPAGPALLVESDQRMPEGTALSGQLLVVEHPAGTTTLTLGEVESLERGRYRLSLAERPRLFQNLLRVTQHVGPTMAVEPPPSLPRQFAQRGYHVFTQPSGHQPVHMGNVTQFTQGLLTIDQAPDTLDDGDTIGVTRLCPGTDIVRIPAFTSWHPEP